MSLGVWLETQERRYPLYTGPAAERYRSTVYERTTVLQPLVRVGYVTVSVAPAPTADGLMRVVERHEQGSWLLGFEVLEHHPTHAVMRLRQLDYTYRQRVFPPFDPDTLAALDRDQYRLSGLWDDQDYYVGVDALCVGVLRRTDDGVSFAISLYDVPSTEPAVLHEPVQCTGVYDQLSRCVGTLWDSDT